MEDRLVYAYFNNTMYVSFIMETVGSSVRSEGGTVSYAKDGATVSSLSNNSLTMSPNQTLTITINPKANYRFDSIMELIPLSTPDANGFKQYSNTYSPLSATEDGSIQMLYYTDDWQLIEDVNDYAGRIGHVVVTINNLAENTIYKIRFWKQVEVTSSVQFVTDEMDGTFLPNYTLAIDSDNSSPDGLYDYNANLVYDIKYSLPENIFSGWSKYYQFVGYFINGINSYTQLVQNYPGSYQGNFILNDLDGLSNGVNIVEKTTVIMGVPYTTYNVEIVARFIPIYNVVIENEYLDSGDYLNPGQITASAIMYDESLTQYYTSSSNVEPKLGSSVSYNTDMSFQMLGKINTIDTSNKNSASSTYNTWKDNMITLSWLGGESESDSFSFIAWQYYAYDKDSESFSWKNIPYVDTNSQTNLVTKPNFTFPVSCLFSTSYLANVSSTGVCNLAGFAYEASVYDYNGEYQSSNRINAIRIRPLFQKVEKLELVKSTAVYDENIFLDGIGEVDPKISSTSRSSGYFNYHTVQTLIPATISGYQFAGWYITENGNGGHQALNLLATATDNDRIIVDGATTYYLHTVAIKDTAGNDTGKTISYSYNPAVEQAYVLMDSSFTIFARYVRVYEINVRISNVSGFSQVLTDSLPTLNCYMLVDGEWELQGDLSGSRMISIKEARVGSKLKFTLSTNFSGNLSDTVCFNPMYDRFVGITAVNDNNLNVWDSNGSTDATDSSVPRASELQAYVNSGTVSDLTEYNNKITGMEIIINANVEKTVDVNFESFGTLILRNVYVGSSIRLPEELGKALYDANSSSVELSTDAWGNDAYFVKDGGIGDSYEGGIIDGIIALNSIPIKANRSFDGQENGDYATRLIDTASVLNSDNISIGVNFDGSNITKKVQNIVYYGSASWVEYEYVDGVLTPVSKEATSLYDYPFADGGIVGKAGDGSVGNPFKIANVDHLRNIDNIYKGNYGSFIYGYINGVAQRINFKQVADINLSETNNALTSPLCSSFYGMGGVYYSNGFNGVYDGGNYALYNLQFELRSSNISENVGIFSRVYRGGEIRNVAIGRSSVRTNAVNVGVLAGSVFGGTISNVYYKEIGTQSISNNVTGSNFVGGLVGLLSGEFSPQGTIENSNIANFTVIATKGGSYLGSGRDYTGGAGGLVGSIGAYGVVAGVKDGYTVSGVTVSSGASMNESGIGAGGLVGTIQASHDPYMSDALRNVVVIDTNLSNGELKVAIGGVVGSVGTGRRIFDATYKVVNNDASISSYSAPSGFTEPTIGADGNYLSYGGGGIAGYNRGTIDNCNVYTTDNYKLKLKGTMVGGIVGVNLGYVHDSTVKARLYTTREIINTFEGGTYGGMVGFNMGSVIGGSVAGVKTATDDYDATSAMYEIVTNDMSVYAPVSGNNGIMHGDPGSDTSTIYVGGIVGYNMGEVLNVTSNAKIMVNRRTNDELSNYSYVGAICGFSISNNISSNYGVTRIKYFHYLWVEQATDINNRMYAYVGNNRGNGITSSGSTVVYADVEYVGGGTSFTAANDEFSFANTYASGYLSGTASVYFYETDGYTASSYAPDWNSGNTIETAKSSDKVYSEDCEETRGSISIWGAWNYTGTLRYVNVSQTKVPS
ncbi:MAG: hypothetical protein IKB56_00645 [Clostridia bacterium]|nr:hypothetical protein [Clostridia bacterium]